MNISQFFYSIILLILGQIPLIIKLWLDHHSRVDQYRKELFERQINSYIEIYIAITNLHWSFFSVIDLYAIKNSEKDKTIWDGITSGLITHYSEWRNVLRKTEFVLPSNLVKATWDYHTNAAKILGACVVSGKYSPKIVLSDIWKDQTLLYNSIVNNLRIRAGIDSLSKEVLSMVEEKRKQFVVQEFNTSIFDVSMKND